MIDLITLRAAAQKIKLLVLDVDGVLTDGRLYFGPHGEELKAFHVHDGLGIKRLQHHGIRAAVITSRNSLAVTHRCHQLGIEYVYQNQADKWPALCGLMQQLVLELDQVAYLGDDLPDLPLMTKVGLGVAVANAVATVKEQAHWQTHTRGGEGAVRELCELLINAN